MKKTYSILTLLSAAICLSFTSCSKNNDDPVDNSLRITKFSAPVDTTILLGASMLIEVEFNYPTSGATFSWTVNGNEVSSTGSSYTFSPAEPGKYHVGFNVPSNMPYPLERLTRVNVMRYWGGFYTLNEGSFGSASGSLNYYNPTTRTLYKNVFSANNPGKDLGMTAQYGTVWNGVLYIVSKGDMFYNSAKSKLTSIDLMSMKQLASVELDPAAEGYANSFAGVSETQGVITTSSGAYPLNLSTLKTGTVLDQSNAGVENGAAITVGNHIYVINSAQGILVYSAADFSFVKNLGMASVGFAVSKDGSLWAANDTQLIKIDTKTVTASVIELPAGVILNNSWGMWNSGSLCAAKDENAIFFAQTGAWNTGGNTIYKYVIGDLSSLNVPFVTGGALDDFYGAALSVDPRTGDLVVNYIDTNWGFGKNRIVFYDSKTGVEKSRFIYPTNEQLFPAMTIYEK